MSLPSSLSSASLDALPMQLAVLDTDGTIRYTNRAWRTFGKENGYVGDVSSVGSNYLGVCEASADADGKDIGTGIRSVIDGERDDFSYEYPCHSPDERRWFTMRASRFSHEGETYVQVVHLDITDRKLAELEADEKASRLRNVASILSHDLRNPLAVALGYAQTVLDEGIATDRLGRIVDALERMDDIISDTLLLARNDSVTELTAVELETEANSAWKHVEMDGDSLVVADSLSFEADSSLLSNLFENLYRNSAEHGKPDDAPLTVTVGALTEDGRTGFYVEDDGVGIPADERDTVFEDGYSSETDGTGLGLSIVSQVAEAHDWCLDLTESESGGARFEISGVEVSR
ncbi:MULTISPECIES: PAS domain-containing sensor histidine kinase [Haloferax]|uniref:histidine kinase n=1 Tax=Haloferax marinum TaxID=2666143 RepID=A0A6A8G5X5_9EURY|nr:MULTISPECIES: PAS domain-containing sensor histidine kinase [Haloferax]KAB1197608.1 PAS domain-containing protein [Haloferax sp. CBA1150]MRW96660.1 PAS domain-containing protein [Haloferax marinum]